MITLEQEIKRLQQIVIEDEYDRKNIRERVASDVMQGIDTQLTNEFINACECIDAYMGKVYTKKKEERLWQIRHIPSSDIAAEIIMAVISCQKVTAIQPVLAQLSKYLEFENTLEGVKTAAELIAVCGGSGLYDLWVNPMRLQCQFAVSAETQDFINNTQYLPPSIVPLKNWTNNTNGGYITRCNSSILGKHHHHEDKQCPDVLNILQGIEWQLDTIALQEQEVSKKPLDTPEKIANHALLVSISKVIYDLMLRLGNSFYILWQTDHRGRLYDAGYHIHFQSGEYKKSLMDFIPEVIPV